MTRDMYEAFKNINYKTCYGCVDFTHHKKIGKTANYATPACDDYSVYPKTVMKDGNNE